MTLTYNPIVRTFCAVRAVLVNDFAIDRECVRPDVPLTALLPAEQHPLLCHRLQVAGLPAPEVGSRTRDDYPLCPFGCLFPLAFSLLPAVFRLWLVVPITFLLGMQLAILALRVKRTETVYVPITPTTVGELVIAMIRFGDHHGYRFSRNEIALKVRLLVAESVGTRLDAITEDTNFIWDLE